ncbi:hypothetical protein D3C72_840820 [compost metagenome]
MLFNRCQVTEVDPLESFFCVISRLGDIKSVHFCQNFKFTKSTNLFRQLFAKTNYILIDHIKFQLFEFMLLLINQEIHTIQSNSTVVPDNTAATISIWKTCNNTGFTRCSHVRSIGIEYTLVMSFPNSVKDINNFFGQFEAICLTSINHHPDSSERLNGTLERSIRLHADDLFFLFIQITRFMGNNS